MASGAWGLAGRLIVGPGCWFGYDFATKLLQKSLCLQRQSGTLTLVADFDRNTLSGTSDNSLLRVNGTFEGKALGGSVVYRGMSGELSGRVGANQAVGAFHGKTDTSIMAGGFMVDETSD